MKLTFTHDTNSTISTAIVDGTSASSGQGALHSHRAQERQLTVQGESAFDSVLREHGDAGGRDGGHAGDREPAAAGGHEGVGGQAVVVDAGVAEGPCSQAAAGQIGAVRERVAG